VAIPLLPKDTTSETVGYLHTIPFNAERQAARLRIPNFKVFWSDYAPPNWKPLKNFLSCSAAVAVQSLKLIFLIFGRKIIVT